MKCFLYSNELILQLVTVKSTALSLLSKDGSSLKHSHKVPEVFQ